MSLRSTTRSQAGFTLVELAIVMIIIGLLIGGVLKGQQLITNAQVAAQVAQFKAVDAATTSFRDMYAGVPGDFGTAASPATGRLPGCAAGTICATNGNADGRLTTAPGVLPTAENQAFFPQLAAANLVTGVNPAIAACAANWISCFPSGKVSGTGIMPGYTAGNAGLTNQLNVVAGNVRGGTYLTLNNNPNAAMDAIGSITANVASRIDLKVDDGVPNSGAVLAAGAGACTLAGPPVTYNEAVDAKNCNLYVQIQN